MQKCGGLRPPRPISIHSASSDSNVTNGSSTGPPGGRHAGDRKLQGHVGHHHQRPGKVASFQSALQFPKFDKASVGHKTIRPPGSGHATSGLPAPGSATAGGFGGVSNNGSTPYSAHSEPGGHCELPLPSVDNGRRSSSGSSNLSTNVAAGIAVMRRNGGGGIPAPRTRPTSVRVESITSPAPLTPSSGVLNGNPYHRDNNNGASNGHQSSLSANNGTKGTPLSALASPPATLAGYRSKSPPASGVPRPMRGNFSSNGPSNPLMSSKSRQATKSTDSLLIEDASNNVSNGNCNVARVSPIRRQLADPEVGQGKMSVNSSNNRPKSAASATSSNSSCNAANDGNNNATHCKGPLYDGLYDISNMTLANGCLKSTSRTGSGKATTQATFGPLQGRPADPGVRGDKQSQLPEIVAAGPVTGPPLAFGGSKSQRDMMAKETPRAHLDCPQFKAARVGDIGQQLPSLASSSTLSSSPSSSPPAKGDPGPNVKLKSLPPAMAAIAGHPSHICYSSSSTPNLHNDFTKAHPSPLAVTGDPNRLSRPNNGRPLDGKGSPVGGHNFAHYQSHQDQHALSRKLDATTGSASRDDATNHFAPCVTVTHQGDRLITKSISEHMLTPLPITGSVQTNGHQLTDSSKAGQCDVQQQLQQQQQHASNSSHVRRFTEGPPTCPIPSGKEFMRQKAINNGCLSSMKEENENVCSNNAFNKLVSNLNAIANGHRTLPSYRSNLDSSAECQGSLRSLVTPPPTPALSSTSTNHIRRLSETSDLRGSASSLAACSTFSASEEKQATELKKLKSELYRASEKVTLLSSQLVTNSQMVVAFEQSLASMTARLHQMSLNGEHKDREISRLKVTIDQLRKEYTLALSQNGRRGSLDNFHGASSESDMDSGKKKSPSSRSQSRDRGDDDQRPGWLRGSITKAFRKSRPRNKVHENCPIMVEHESEHNGDRSGPCNLSPLRHISSPNPSSQLSPGVPLPLASPRYPFGVTDDEARGAPSSFPSSSSSFLPSPGPLGQSAAQRDPELRHQLMDKERALTDIRLEALTTAHKMDGMKEEMKRLKLEIDSLRQENKRLQRLLYKQSQLTSSSHSSNTSVNGFVTHGHELYNGDKGAKGKSLPTAEGNNNNNHNCKDNSMHISDPLLNTLLRLQEAAAIN